MLTGMPAGRARKDGTYSEGTLFRRVTDSLEAMTRRAVENRWLGLPIQQQQGSNNNEEEREGHKNPVAREEAGWSVKPPPPVVATREERVRIAHVPVLLRSAQIPNPHPSVLSTRLLI